VVAQPCGCKPSQAMVDVSGNGSNSKTTVTTKNTLRRSVRQTTDTGVYADQHTKSNTGKNTIKNSTGKGSNTVETGNSTTKNTVVVESGSNLLGPSM
ncbi:MAG: hypothetical protein N3A54_04890, partial [Patescibacteria group bacterium]|nr:hypothetical protein [Patescibacteria group bacterium]